MGNLETIKKTLIAEIERRVDDKIIENTNAQLIIKLINSAESINEAIMIGELGTTYKRTGLHFDKRFEKLTNTIKYLKKNDKLSFEDDKTKLKHKLIIGDNYDALLNLLVTYRNKIDVIYIDPPYSKDSMGEFASTNYENALTRDNLLSMLYPRLVLAKELLDKDSGVIFCSIDDRNQSYVKCLFDEIFGEKGFLFNVPRITKKGGKSTVTMAKNNDYILGYTLSDDLIFEQEEMDLDKYSYEDEYVEQRGKYRVSQTLDYDTLGYVNSLDFPITIDGITYYPGSVTEEEYKKRKSENPKDGFRWRWSKDLVEFGLKNKFLCVNKNTGRIYSKTYEKAKIKKENGEYTIIEKKPTKAYTTLSYIDNQYSNDNGKKELDTIFDNSSSLFKNPKPSVLISTLIKMVCDKNDAIILDFFAGSGTTGQSVLELNKEDKENPGNRRFILCTNNEITENNPNGIAYDVTSKRLKRIMSGECYDKSKDFKLANNKFEPYGNSLDVYEIETVANFERTAGKTPFDVIDETAYDIPKFENIKDKIEWVCSNFEITEKNIESDNEWKNRMEEK